MDKAKILNTLQNMMVDTLHLPVLPDQLGEDTYLFYEGLELDSLDMTIFAVSIKKEFGVEMVNTDFSETSTVGYVVNKIFEKRQENMYA